MTHELVISGTRNIYHYGNILEDISNTPSLNYPELYTGLLQWCRVMPMPYYTIFKVFHVYYRAKHHNPFNSVGLCGIYEVAGSESLWLWWFAVHSKERGKGIGSTILRYAKTQTKLLGYKSLKVWVSENNENALKFYLKNGFIRVGRSVTDETPADSTDILLLCML